MFGNFDSPMQLADKGQTLVACGPLQWADGETTAVTITVTFIDEGVQAVSGRTFSNTDSEWMFLMPADELKPGLTRARGVATDAAGEIADEWEQTIRLTRAALSEEEIREIVADEIAKIIASGAA